MPDARIARDANGHPSRARHRRRNEIRVRAEADEQEATCCVAVSVRSVEQKRCAFVAFELAITPAAFADASELSLIGKGYARLIRKEADGDCFNRRRLLNRGLKLDVDVVLIFH